MIEHNLDVIKTASGLFGLGPEGGAGGGQIIATSAPENGAAQLVSLPSALLDLARKIGSVAQ